MNNYRIGLTVLTLLISLPAFGGKERGNGGGAFVCRNANGKILSAQLVDLYEAGARYSLKLRPNTGLTQQEQIDLAMARLLRGNLDLGTEIESRLNHVSKIIHIVENAKLTNSNDFNIQISPKACAGGRIEFEQLANYTDTGELLVDREIWAALSSMDQAALYLHEAIYLYSRELFRVETSQASRRLVAYLFSTLNPKSYVEEAFDLAPQGTIYVCEIYYTNSACFEGTGCPLFEHQTLDVPWPFFGDSIKGAWAEYLKNKNENTKPTLKGWTPCNNSVFVNFTSRNTLVKCEEEPTQLRNCSIKTP